jgi:hypothetical protein
MQHTLLASQSAGTSAMAKCTKILSFGFICWLLASLQGSCNVVCPTAGLPSSVMSAFIVLCGLFNP